MDPDLTPEKAKTLSCQWEAISKQQGLLHKLSPPPKDSSIAYLKRGKEPDNQSAGKAAAKPNDIDHKTSPNAHDVGRDTTRGSSVLLTRSSFHRCKKKSYF